MDETEVPPREYGIRAGGLRPTATMVVGDGGWIAYADWDFPDWVSVRVQPDERGRLVMVELHLERDRIDSATLRALPLGRIETLLNTPRYAVEIQRRLRNPPRPGIEPHGGKPREPWAAPAVTGVIPFLETPLEVPKGRKPDSFYRRVGEIYSELGVVGNRPAADLAELAGRPVVTVHRWVAEARRRGYLPPASPGRRG
jgi:hypothetical protein